jgi:hypothetical protein
MRHRAQDHRTELFKLSELQELLEQLLIVRQLPEELRDLMARGDVGSAVLLCSKAQPLLQSHGHYALLRPVFDGMTQCTLVREALRCDRANQYIRHTTLQLPSNVVCRTLHACALLMVRHRLARPVTCCMAHAITPGATYRR